ncbi:hypothetical protein [Actinomadura opuntiae]|uniref:hypothetical protein n=1 Tax=Actinomadura sp. OS1-43 TaxID=604315 RepID=UPI00255A84DD|nr:hypothetical protein [Actinomadura sp. OS1-43]MDL4820060.1 hypothetical protein [Actinomadura sp. OS1-43]
MSRSTISTAVLAAVTATVAASTAASASASASASAAAAADTPAGPQAPVCSWTEGGSRFANTAYPDTSARYWVAPFTVQPGLHITLHGTFPDSRYISVSVYDAAKNSFTTNGVQATLPDYRIAPDKGQTNPWQRRARPGGTFTVTLRADAAPGQANTLPLAPAGTPDGATGQILFRSYLDSGNVPLPQVTFERDGISRTLAPCAPPPVTPGKPTGEPSQGDPSAPVVFNRGSGAGLYPNLDSAYLSARVQPPGDGRVIVVRAKAPRTVKGDRPQPWPARGADLRYWSMCSNIVVPPYPVVMNHLADGSLDAGCRTDHQTRVDRHGYYTYVLGSEAQRPAISRLRDVTFLPFSSDMPDALHLLLIRNMVTAPGFHHSVLDVPLGATAQTAGTVMGAYYPHGAVCDLAALKRHAGLDRCLQNS